MSDDTFELYVPDYDTECENGCPLPVVTLVKDGREVGRTDMCGPCTWGDADTVDPDTWN